jgi:hypothetical protein
MSWWAERLAVHDRGSPSRYLDDERAERQAEWLIKVTNHFLYDASPA